MCLPVVRSGPDYHPGLFLANYRAKFVKTLSCHPASRQFTNTIRYSTARSPQILHRARLNASPTVSGDRGIAARASMATSWTCPAAHSKNSAWPGRSDSSVGLSAGFMGWKIVQCTDHFEGAVPVPKTARQYGNLSQICGFGWEAVPTSIQQHSPQRVSFTPKMSAVRARHDPPLTH